MDIKNILSNLTVEEKISLLAGKTAWSLMDIERLNVPEIFVTDGPHGVRWSPGSNFSETKPATSLPIESAMASTFNTELIKEAGKLAAIECHHYDIGVLLGPGVNGKRSPLAGRNFEYYSEDPFLSGKMASAFINGVQGQGIGTCLKHFAVNDQETRRITINAEVDQRALHEIYLAPFKMAIKEANPWSIMSAYNKVNGEHACQSANLLIDILRDEYKYNGVVMSDWGGTIDKSLSHINGLDLEMPGPSGRNVELVNAYKNGKLSIETLDTRVTNVLNLIKKAEDNRRDVSVDWNQHHRIAQEVAAESMVLLKNEENILPFKKGDTLAVIGDFVKELRFQGGGSSKMNPMKLDEILDELSIFTETSYATGYTKGKTSNDLLEEAKNVAKGKDNVVIFIGTTEEIESEGYDRQDMKLPNAHIQLVNAIYEVNKNIVVVINSGSAVETRQIEKSTSAIIQAWLPGEGGGNAIARILFGDVNPSGKLSETFPICLENNPTYGFFPGFKDLTTYNESIFVGYRYYDTKKIKTQYAFGHGLSYTNFEYSNINFSSKEIDCNQKLVVSVDITNTGSVEGKEVVQLYVHDCESYLVRPYKELKSFSKVSLIAGETKTVVMELGKDAFEYFIPHLNRFSVESGDFKVLVGSSSEDIRVEEIIKVHSNDVVAIPMDENDTVLEWLREKETNKIIVKLLKIININEDHPLYAIVLGLPVKRVFAVMKMFGAPEAFINQLEMAVLGDRNSSLMILRKIEEAMIK